MVEDRVKELEGGVIALGREVSGLSSTLDSHITQYGKDQQTLADDGQVKHVEIVGILKTLETGISSNSQKLGNIKAVREAFEKQGLTTNEYNRPILNGKARVAGAGVLGIGGIYVFVEIAQKVLEFLKNLGT